MKFVFINTGSHKRTGRFIRSLGLGEQLVKKGHEVIILATDHHDNINTFGKQFNGINFIYSSRINFIKHLQRIFQIFFQKKIDVVHCMGVSTSVLLPALICKIFFLKKFKLIVDHEDKQSVAVSKKVFKIFLFLENLSYKYADKLIFASKLFADEIKLQSDKTFYLPFAMNLPVNFKKLTQKSINPNEVLELCYLGVLIEIYKDQIDFLINSVPYLKNRIKKFRINIVGIGKLKEYFQDKIKKLGLENEIVFHGFIPDENLNKFLLEMNILILNFPDTPINKYRCPNKIFVYCITGLPIVSSRNGEVGKILSAYPNAVFFEPNNYESFTNAISNAMSSNNIIPDDFYIKNSWENRVNTYLEIYK
ncbi:glycosyltransferase [Candidatus Poribacteria bacterium]|nr:glycosyltransferase [Candidatus Poribacteria bacterium]